jgi:hypothetical protein
VVNAPLANAGLLLVHGSCTLNGALTTVAGSTLRVEGSNNSNPNQGYLIVANGFTNNGTVELTDVAAGYGARLDVTSGTLVNAAGHVINSLAGASGPRSLNAELDNRGTLTVGASSYALSISRADAAHQNSGTLDVSGGDLVLSQSGTPASFTNSGTVTVAAGRTWTVIGGAFNLDSTSVVSLKIAGSNPSPGYGRIAVSGAVVLDGTLSPSFVDGYTPIAGQSFQVMTYGSKSGGFAHMTGLSLGGGLSFLPQISGTGVTLLTVGQTWVRELPDGASPPAREAHSAVFDSTTDRMIVFGGRSDSGPLNDVWVLTHADGQGGNPAWAQLAPGGGSPPPRANQSAIYDPVSNRMVIYGGDNEAPITPTTFGDIWVLTHANGLGGTPEWSKFAPSGVSPPSRTEHSAVYDAATNRMIVFGGNSAAPCGGGLNDVWVLIDANGIGSPTWNQLTAAAGPPSARSGAHASYDPASNRMTVVGGLVPCGLANNDIWLLSDANGIGSPIWSLILASGSPPSPWSQQTAVYDAATNRVTVFGGATTAGLTNQVLTLTGANSLSGTPAWVDLTPTSGPPEARSLASAVEATQSRMIVFGGRGNGARLRDVWVLEQTQGRVVSVPPPVEPPRHYSTGFSRPPAPNPSSGATTFAVALAREQKVELTISDVSGRLISTIERGRLGAGEFNYVWKGETVAGGRAATGVYFLRFKAEDLSQVRRIVLTR